MVIARPNVGKAEGHEHFIPHVVPVCAGAQALDHHPQQVVRGIVVQKVVARLEVDCLVLEDREQFVVAQIEPLFGAERRDRGEAAKAGGVIQQLADRHVGSAPLKAR